MTFNEALEKINLKDETMETIITAASYNRLTLQVATWPYEYLKRLRDCNDVRIFKDEKATYMGNPSNVGLSQSQLQFIWMIMVQKYGDYKKSPRVGWIKNINEFVKTCFKFEAVEFYNIYNKFDTDPDKSDDDKATDIANCIYNLCDDIDDHLKLMFIADYHIYKCILLEEADEDCFKAEEIFINDMYAEFAEQLCEIYKELRKKFNILEED